MVEKKCNAGAQILPHLTVTSLLRGHSFNFPTILYVGGCKSEFTFIPNRVRQPNQQWNSVVHCAGHPDTTEPCTLVTKHFQNSFRCCSVSLPSVSRWLHMFLQTWQYTTPSYPTGSDHPNKVDSFQEKSVQDSVETFCTRSLFCLNTFPLNTLSAFRVVH